MEIKSLESLSLEYLVDVFLDAFSDYATIFSREQIHSNLRRRGFKADHSFGLFDNGQLVSFVFNGIGQYKGQQTVYDTGTGTIKAYRGKGLTTQLLEQAESYLKTKQVNGYLLEVLCDNAPAVALYKKIGFEIVRNFSCHVQNISSLRMPASKCSCAEIVSIAPSAISALSDVYCDAEPSWQNNMQAIVNSSDELSCIGAIFRGEIVGYIVGDTTAGDILQIAVRKDCRNKGIGTELLRSFIRINKANILKVLNIDDNGESLRSFLNCCNMPVTASQYEMYKAF